MGRWPVPGRRAIGCPVSLNSYHLVREQAGLDKVEVLMDIPIAYVDQARLDAVASPWGVGRFLLSSSQPPGEDAQPHRMPSVIRPAFQRKGDVSPCHRPPCLGIQNKPTLSWLFSPPPTFRDTTPANSPFP